MCVAITADGSTIASGSSDKNVKLWDVSTGAAVQSLKGNVAGVMSLSFTQDGSVLSSISSDGTMKKRDMKTFCCTDTCETSSDDDEFNAEEDGVVFCESDQYNVIARENVIEVRQRWTHEHTLMLCAASCGDIKLYDSHKKDTRSSVETTYEGGPTPLFLAASKGRTEMVDNLLEKQANPNAQTSSGLTPLVPASAGGYADIVTALLKNDADPNLQSSTGQTALMSASQGGHAGKREI